MIEKKLHRNNKSASKILSVRGHHPHIDPSAWVADTAVLVGDVVIAAHATVWFQAVVRGDVGAIRIGEATNIQDQVVIHCTYQKTDTWVGDRVSVGHGAILHGCRIEDEALIGMRAVLLDGAHVGKHVIVAAGAVVLEGQQLTSGFLYAGVPARKRKPLTEEQKKWILRTANNYPLYASWFQKKETKA